MLERLAQRAEGAGLETLLELERLERTLRSGAQKCRVAKDALGNLIFGSAEEARRRVHAARGRKPN